MNALPSARTFDPARRGYLVAYRPGEMNRCPGCGRSHWHVGRLSAECGFCATALPLIESARRGAGVIWRGRAPAEALLDAA